MDDDRKLRDPPTIARDDAHVLQMDELRDRLPEIVDQAASGAVLLIAAPGGKRAVLLSYEMYTRGNDLRSLLLERGSGPDRDDPTDVGQ